jgi:hypothetical protein
MADGEILKKGRWAKEEIKFLKKRFSYIDTRELAAQLGRPLQAVRQRAYELGLRRKAYRGKWTESEINLLMELFGTKKKSEMVRLVGRTESAIANKAYKIGLRKKHARMA